ncbi:AsnC family transcriptional regulator [Candidatus Woesearchaeota archaeon]|nr:AsnC family transcriptional regulator [Candidatus Woesearchaeota archaeon]
MVKITKDKLDLIDKKILAELDKNCRIPSSILARKVKKSRQTVEYRINKLVERGIITSFNAAFNPHKMGYKIYKVYLKLRNLPEDKGNLFEFLKSSGIVYWMGECSGSWDLIFGVFSKDDYEFYRLKNEITSKFQKIILKEYGDILIDVKQYSKMYFTNEIVEPTMFAGRIIPSTMDELDYSILGEIVNNARISIIDLAKRTGTTQSIARGKLNRMEEKGIIIQYRIGINLNKLGLELYKAIIKLDRYTKEDEAKLLTYLSNVPNIHYYIRNIWQIEPELVVSNYQEYYKIIERLKEEFPYVIRSVDSVLMITDEWTPGFRNLLKVQSE